MPTLSQCTDEVLLALNGYGAPAPRASFLTAAVTASATSLTVGSTTDFNQGLIEVDGELMYVETVEADGVTLTLSPDGRGFYGTTPAAHAAGARVSMNPPWPRTRVEAAINEAIEGTHPMLFGVATTSFTYSPAQSTYPLPADCTQVLLVSADTVGPSKEQQIVRRYATDLSAPVALFPTSNALTLQESVTPGRTVTVTYKKAPAAIATTDDFTVSGLRQTAWKAVRLSALSELLAAMDAQRLSVDTAAAGEESDRNQLGSAARVSTQLWQRYQIELELERKRLAAETKPPITMRSR